MSAPEPASNLDANVFDIDAWIDGIERPQLVVTLYPYEAMHEAKVAQIEKALARAERTQEGDRGLDEPSVNQLMAQMDAINAERERMALRVTVQQPTDVELADGVIAWQKARRADGTAYPESDAYLWSIATACVTPKFTGEQLYKLRTRDRSGEYMVIQLQAACDQLMEPLPVPSSPER
jgi:DNA-binding transcriptional regulator YdaS (Cro superfamily)